MGTDGRLCRPVAASAAAPRLRTRCVPGVPSFAALPLRRSVEAKAKAACSPRALAWAALRCCKPRPWYARGAPSMLEHVMPTPCYRCRCFCSMQSRFQRNRLCAWGPKIFPLGSKIQRHVRSSRHVRIERQPPRVVIALSFNPNIAASPARGAGFLGTPNGKFWGPKQIASFAGSSTAQSKTTGRQHNRAPRGE